jgi:hypothetical protein
MIQTQLRRCVLKQVSLASYVLVGLLLAAGTQVVAHHGTSASYDLNKPTEISGVVTEFVWANPHARLFLDVTGADGKVVNWGIEMRPAPNGMSRQGWNRNTLQKGDKLTITVFPSKFGTPTGVGEPNYPIVKNGTQLPGTGGGTNLPPAAGAGRGA